jgi:hypothetical protein
MTFSNRVVCRLLESPVHRLMSRSTDVIRYRGRRSGEMFTTPTQFAAYQDGLVILVGRPDTKSWWRNFRADRDIDVLIDGEWRAMTGRAVDGATEPDTIGPLLDAYLKRFPKAARRLDARTGVAGHVGAVVVWCRPR